MRNIQIFIEFYFIKSKQEIFSQYLNYRDYDGQRVNAQIGILVIFIKAGLFGYKSMTLELILPSLHEFESGR